jgi:predicted acylesterase/phospholipase RssA
VAHEVTAAPADDATTPEDPWRVLRRQQDRRRYLRILAARRSPNDKPRRPDPAQGVPRPAHPLLGSPASVTRTPGHVPDQLDVRAYLRHSCDITMSGGNALGLVYPLAACALAEHYVFRRIGGSSTGSIAAAATAAAELGRGAPDAARPSDAERDAGGAPDVVPGFAGLAQAVGWLAGSRDGGSRPTRGNRQRLARLIQPTPAARGLFRMLTAVLRQPGRSTAGTAARLLVGGLGVPGRTGRAAIALTWLTVLAVWVGLTSALVAGARAGAVPEAVPVVTSVGLLVVAALGGMFVTAVVVAAAGLRTWNAGAADEYFGLVSGVAEPGRRHGRVSRAIDRWIGLRPPGDTPPLVEWVAERIDDLAGIPAGAERRALTFGDLWSGSIDERGPAANARVRRAALEPEHRTINLVLVATDLSEGRAYRFPQAPAEHAERTGGARLLFCEPCLAAVLPQRVVTQMVKSAPSTDTDHYCPRHSVGVLRELPEPWDLPVIAAVRMSGATPGLLRAVPLYTIDEAGPEAPAGAGTTVRTHWFADGGVAGNVPVSYFDALLPRWPTFGVSVQGADDDVPGPRLRMPAQDAAPARRTVRGLGSGVDLAAAVLDTVLGGRDATQAELPGFRGRLALVRRAAAERGRAFLLGDAAVLSLALDGLAAGTALRERFTGSDDDVPGQTQTDRYRWIRLRMALREYRTMSLDIGARLPLYRDLASVYHVPAALGPWFDPPLPPAERDPVWAEAVTVVTTLRALSTGGVLDFDVDRGAPPVDPDLRIVAPE